MAVAHSYCYELLVQPVIAMDFQSSPSPGPVLVLSTAVLMTVNLALAGCAQIIFNTPVMETWTICLARVASLYML